MRAVLGIKIATLGTKRCKCDILILFQLFNAKVKKPEDRIAFENVKRAFDEMYAFCGVLYVCCLSLSDGFMSKMENTTEEEKVKVHERMLSNTLAMYEDAAEILGW